MLAPAVLAAAALVPTPIGRGPAFHPPATTPAQCTRAPVQGRYRAHVELFARRRVIVVPAGIGVAAARVARTGRIEAAGCRARVRTLDPTGVLHFGATGLTLHDLFATWRMPFGPRRLLSFEGRVVAFVDGRRHTGNVGDIPLRDRAQIVLEVGGYVPPHASYRFPR